MWLIGVDGLLAGACYEVYVHSLSYAPTELFSNLIGQRDLFLGSNSRHRKPIKFTLSGSVKLAIESEIVKRLGTGQTQQTDIGSIYVTWLASPPQPH